VRQGSRATFHEHCQGKGPNDKCESLGRKTELRRDQISMSRKYIVVLLVALSLLGAQAQNSANQAQGKRSRVKPKTEEQVLLEQLSEKLQALDRVSDKVDGLEQQVQDLKRQLQESNKTAEAARSDAAQARKELESAQQVVGHNDEQVANLKAAVSDLTSTSTSIVETVQAEQKTQRALEHPDSLHFKGIELKPGGFLAAETVDRQRGIGGDVNTSFNSIPFAGTTAGVLSEFNASGRQSRISLLAEGKLSKSTVRGYYEADFLSAGTTSNDNQSNSYTLRQRQVWAQAALNSGWTMTGGQMWSLATEYKHGLDNLSEAIPLTIDAQYNVGFTWERQYGFRVTKNLGSKLWVGGAVEEAQTLNIGGHNLPTIAYQQAGNSGGLYNPSANYSFNYAPDLVAKIAYEPGFGHYELFGVGRFFRDRVFPNGQLPSGASALGAFTSKAAGGGVGANARIPLIARRMDLGAHILVGDGIGRYSSATLPDATAHPDGSLELLAGGSALGSLEWHTTPRLDLYAYYGGEYVKRAFYPNGLFVTTPGPTYGQPILVGYGAPNNVVSGCYTETLPTNGLTNGPSSATCQADNRNIQEGTFGYWFRFYKGPLGTFQQGIQYSYAERHTWQGIGDPLTGLGGSPKAIDNMWFTSFRYYLPQ
jgi:outer membrane murein-binding lipoprotein Lpp